VAIVGKQACANSAQLSASGFALGRALPRTSKRALLF
jgi:hypothetical protein